MLSAGVLWTLFFLREEKKIEKKNKRDRQQLQQQKLKSITILAFKQNDWHLTVAVTCVHSVSANQISFFS